LWALKLIEYVPAVPVAGVPLSVPVSLPLSRKVTPLGKAPVSVRIEVGKPVVVRLNEPDVPTVKVALLALVIAGAWSTVSVKVCVASAPIPLCAVKVREYVPAVPAAGVPASFPVAGVNVTPEGRVPLSASVGAGKPVAVTVKVPAAPTVNMVLLALVMAAA
jgi:hypothetical protein